MSVSSQGHTRRSSKKDIIDHSLYPPFIKQMDVKLPEYVREGDIEYPFEETTGVGDENRIRGNWCNRADYLLAATGFTFGIGVGIAMVITSCVLAVYLNIVSSWSLFYFISSISFSLPWSNCENSWSGLNCTLGTRMACADANGTLLGNGTCMQKLFTLFSNDVLMLSDAFDEIGTLNWYLGICVLLSWIAIFLCLFQGVKSSGKVVYVVVVLPFIIMTVLLARLLTLDGSFAAVSYFLKPNWNVLKDLKVWGEAAVHAFYSVCCCTGGLFTISSYNRFHNNIFNIADGVHLVFGFLAEALAGVPVAPLYAGLFFLMLLLIIHSTQLFVVSFLFSAGLYWLLLLAKFTITWPLVVIAFLECMAISWVYGVDNLLDNIKWITGSYPPCYIFWKILWKFICPLVYLSILCFLWLDWQSVSYESYLFPYWTSLLGWAISIFPLMFVPITAVVKLCMAKGSLTQKWTNVLNPEDAWGPALAVHRAEHFPLQIPEARRLLLPPELEVTGSHKTVSHEEEDILQVDSELALQGTRFGPSQSVQERSIAATINTVSIFCSDHLHDCIIMTNMPEDSITSTLKKLRMTTLEPEWATICNDLSEMETDGHRHESDAR
uniref:Solute carrier family 6 member 8 n=1 Tax=Heterorhabditis bacteriophora TaxID=37862 RepID=A0A1I7XAZ6_HETBA